MRLAACLLLLLAPGCIAPLTDVGAPAAQPPDADAATPSVAPAWPARVGPPSARAMEPHVAARGNVLVVANHAEFETDEGRTVSLFVHRSEDGGRTWSSALLPRSVTAPFDPLGRMKDGGDAVLAYAPDGTLYLAGAAFAGVSGPQLALINDLTVFVTRSRDDGRTWEPALFHARGAGPMLLMQDKPWLTLGADGALHLAWTEFATPFYTTVKYVRSADGGDTWSAPLDLAATDPVARTQVSGATIAAPGGGRVYVTALELHPSNVLPDDPASRQVAWWSEDDGATFHGPLVLGPAAFPRFGRVTAHGDDPMRAWVLVPDASPAPRMYAVETRDGGLTWSAPASLAPQRTGAQQHPAVWMEDPGTLHVAYYDAGWPGGERVVLARLEEGVVVEERAAPGDPLRPGPYRREYFGLAHDGDDRLWAAWVGGDGGSEDPFAALQGDAGSGTWVAVAPFDV